MILRSKISQTPRKSRKLASIIPSQSNHKNMFVVHTKIIVLLTIGAIFELLIIFGLAYAALARKAGDTYWARVRQTLMLRFR